MHCVESLFRDKQKLRQFLEKIPSKPCFDSLKKAFFESIEQNCRGVGKAAVLSSGGVDSTLIAKAVACRVNKTELFAVGFKGSPALAAADKAADFLRLQLHKTELREKEFRRAIPAVSRVIGSKDFLQLQIALPLYFAMQAASESKFRHVFCGQGADELFFGYNEFRQLLSKHDYYAAEELRTQLVEGMWQNNLSRDGAIASHFALTLHTPYLSPAFVREALAFPAKESLHGQHDLLRKRVLRLLASELGLPKEIAEKRKKAVQYDSGVSKRLKEILQN